MKQIKGWVFKCEADNIFTYSSGVLFFSKDRNPTKTKKDLLEYSKTCTCKKKNCKPVQITISVKINGRRITENTKIYK